MHWVFAGGLLLFCRNGPGWAVGSALGGCWGAPQAPPGRWNPTEVLVAASVLCPLLMRKDSLLLPALVAPLTSPGWDLQQSLQTRNLGVIFALSSLLLPFSLVSKSASLHLHYIDRNSDLVDLVLVEILFSFFFSQIFLYLIKLWGNSCWEQHGSQPVQLNTPLPALWRCAVGWMLICSRGEVTPPKVFRVAGAWPTAAAGPEMGSPVQMVV